MDLHASFWEAAGGDAANYRSLRSAVMRGMLVEHDLGRAHVLAP